MSGWIGAHVHLHDGSRMPGTRSRRARGRRLQDITCQQCQITTDTEDGHDAQVGADGWCGVARLDRAQGVARHACACSKLYRAQVLRLSQALEAVAELQQQLALKEKV